MITQDQVNNVIRHVGTAAGTAVAIFAGLAILNGDQAADATNALKDLFDGLSQAAGGAFKLGIIVGPIIAGAMGKWGWKAVSPPAQIEATGKMGDVKVLVGPNAPPAAQAAAADKAQPDVVAVTQPVIKASSPR